MKRLWRATAACLAVLTMWSWIAAAQTRVHGADSLFVSPTVKLAWAVLKGTAQADTQVVVRISNRAGEYRFMTVEGIDPFTKAHAVFAKGRPLGTGADISIRRDKFADYPSVEFHLYRDEAAMQAGNAAVVVFYLGVPDTTPEFTAFEAMDAYLNKMLGTASSP